MQQPDPNQTTANCNTTAITIDYNNYQPTSSLTNFDPNFYQIDYTQQLSDPLFYNQQAFDCYSFSYPPPTNEFTSFASPELLLTNSQPVYPAVTDPLSEEKRIRREIIHQRIRARYFAKFHSQ